MPDNQCLNGRFYLVLAKKRKISSTLLQNLRCVETFLRLLAIASEFRVRNCFVVPNQGTSVFISNFRAHQGDLFGQLARSDQTIAWELAFVKIFNNSLAFCDTFS